MLLHTGQGHGMLVSRPGQDVAVMQTMDITPVAGEGARRKSSVPALSGACIVIVRGWHQSQGLAPITEIRYTHYSHSYIATDDILLTQGQPRVHPIFMLICHNVGVFA